MKTILITTFLSCCMILNVTAQDFSTATAQMNIDAQFPSGKVATANDITLANLSMKDGMLNIAAFNKAFEVKSKPTANTKAELDATQDHSATSIKGQITNFDKINTSVDGSHKARIIGRFIFNGVTSTFFTKGQLIVENGVLTLSMTLDVLLSDHEVIGAEKGNTMEVDILLNLVAN